MPAAKPQIQIVADVGELSCAAAVEFVGRGHARGMFPFALAGGSSPKSVYALLAGDGAF